MTIKALIPGVLRRWFLYPDTITLTAAAGTSTLIDVRQFRGAIVHFPVAVPAAASVSVYVATAEDGTPSLLNNAAGNPVAIVPASGESFALDEAVFAAGWIALVADVAGDEVTLSLKG
jgi:hypothetical protein